jgi:Protein kinase domain
MVYSSSSLANMLVLYSRKDSVWKLADFGYATEGTSRTLCMSKNVKGTEGYFAPELLVEENPSYYNQVDIWSMGCILYELAVGQKAFYNNIATYEYKMRGITLGVPLDEYFSDACKDCITRNIISMLEIDRTLRPSASDLLVEFTRNCEIKAAYPRANVKIHKDFHRDPDLLSSDTGGINPFIKPATEVRNEGRNEVNGHVHAIMVLREEGESTNTPSFGEIDSPPMPVPTMKYQPANPFQPLKLTNYLPPCKKRNFKTLHLITISPSGRFVGLLAEREWAVFKVAGGTPSFLRTGDYNKKIEGIGKTAELSNLLFNQICCAALSDEFLAVGAQRQMEILLIPVADNLAEHQVLVIKCEALVLLSFSPSGKELLVLGRSLDRTLQQAFFYSVRFPQPQLNRLETDLAWTPFPIKTIKWSDDSGRLQIRAKFSNDSKHVAISTGFSRENGNAQLRLLSKVIGEWQEKVSPLEIAIIDNNRFETGLSADCQGVMGLGL